jgi:endonuclease/exonuclease/phosphatase (EEP) superfamily protein YafD
LSAAPVLRWLIGAALAACLVLIAIGFGGRLHPAFDSFAHFRAHLSAAGFVLALLFFGSGARGPGAVGAIAAVAALLTVASAYVAPERAPAPGGGETFKLLHLNLRFDNPTPEAVFELVTRTRPDVLALNEVSAEWRERLPRLLEVYPFHIVCEARHRIGGVAILSRRPWASAAGEPRCLERGSFAMATLDFGGTKIDISALHLGWPWPYEQAWNVGQVRPELAKLGNPAILVGDFNATPWSATAASVRQAGGLAAISGLGTTWLHHSLPRALLPLGLPIDQAMLKGGIVVHEARTLEPVGSDHLPVLLAFSLPR